MAFYLHPFVSSCQLATGTPGKIFTQREWDIVFLLNQGKRPKDIADRLNLSYKSVRNKISALLTKINVKNTAELVTLCQKNGWHNCMPGSFVERQYTLLACEDFF